MFSLLARVLSARAAAAAIALLTSAIALKLLPSSQYAKASVAIAVSAVFTQFFYQPFSKFVLISGEPSRIRDLFWRSQSLVTAAMLLGVLANYYLRDGYLIGLGAAGAFFAMTQGWKEFCGELARARGDIASMQRLYVLDAITTLLLTVAWLWGSPRAENYILASALSSIFWSAVIMPRPKTVRLLPDWRGVWRVYRYSYGLMGSNVMNSAGLAVARAAILHISPVATAGAIQFVLDTLQKVVALVGSSVVSVALPEVRRRTAGDVVRWLIVIMLLVLLVLFSAMGVMAMIPDEHKGSLAGISLAMGCFCAFFIWAHRYKTTVMDAPLMATETGSAMLLLGAASSLSAMYLFSSQVASVGTMLLACGVAIILGGVVNLIFANLRRLIPMRIALAALAGPGLVVLALVFFTDRAGVV